MADLPKTLKVTASPHTIGQETTRRIMLDVLIALVPSFIAGIIFFGLNALLTVLLCMVLCYVCEQLFNLCMRKPFTTDLSCLVTGMILGLILPPLQLKTLWYIPLVGAVFAIVIIKMLFGGIGKNIANPAATARVFLLLAFSTAMGSFLIPKVNDFVHIDGLTGPTYLGGGYTNLDRTFMGVTGYWGYILQLFFGHVGGSIGETSALAILIGCAYLMVRKVIDWRIPTSYIVSSALMTLICYQTASDVLPQLLSGGLLFGAVFMATDYATCPKYKHNRVLFGIFLGFMTILLRKYSNYPESVSFVIILANLFVPIMDRFILPLRFGQTNKRGKVRVDVYGISMKWIVPVFLVIIIILSSVFAVVNPYVNRFYSNTVNQFTVASANIEDYNNGTTLAYKGDYLFPVKGKTLYVNDKGEQTTDELEYVVVLYVDNATTRATATVKVRDIIQQEYPFTGNVSVPRLIYKAADIDTTNFKDKTLQEVLNLTSDNLTIGGEFSQTSRKNYFLKEAIVESYDYYNFIQRQGVEQFTYSKNVEVNFADTDGLSRPTQENYFAITLQKTKNGQWTVASVINYVVTPNNLGINADVFIGKTLQQIEKLTFNRGKTSIEKANDAMNTALKETVIETFMQAQQSIQKQVQKSLGGVLCKKI